MVIRDEVATKLLAKVPDHVKAAQLRSGQAIIWHSPVFGEVDGEVMQCHDNGTVEVYHPLTEVLVRIPQCWIRRLEVEIDRKAKER